MTDLAARVYNHTWKIDPIVRSLLDTDFYKILMAQTIYRRQRQTRACFSLINRTTKIRLADIIDPGELREQLVHVRTLRLSRGEITWLRGNMFYGRRQMFSPDFMEWFENLKLPEYHLEQRDGQYELTFDGPWVETTMWEIPALAIINEMRSRAVLRGMGRFELQVLYARGMTRVWEKITRLQKLDDLRIADFGTRRRHGFLWQDWCVQAMMEGLGKNFLGTSNCLIAMRREAEAIGTNAHELPMVYSALAKTDAELANAPYQVLADWQQDYEGNLRIILPDTYGTSGFLARAPKWMDAWTGIRIDSKDPIVGGDEAIAWWKGRGVDPMTRQIIFSDGLDVDMIEKIHSHFRGRVRFGFGWGTLLTNDFRGLAPDRTLDPISVVCKVVSANGRPAVKISDNPTKATGPNTEISRYMRVFEVEAQPMREVVV